MQDWGAAIDDFSLVLSYQPHLNDVRLLRARAYACAREWDDAKDDYEEILKVCCLKLGIDCYVLNLYVPIHRLRYNA
jgi:hypothetical protein